MKTRNRTAVLATALVVTMAISVILHEPQPPRPPPFEVLYGAWSGPRNAIEILYSGAYILNFSSNTVMRYGSFSNQMLQVESYSWLGPQTAIRVSYTNGDYDTFHIRNSTTIVWVGMAGSGRNGIFKKANEQDIERMTEMTHRAIMTTDHNPD